MDIKSLLKLQEGDSLDFKREISFKGDAKKTDNQKRADFIKDIISMYNTPRSQDAYIVIGVDKYDDGSYEIVGIDKHFDDEILQNKFNKIVDHIPRFSYEPFELEGQKLALISIPPDKTRGPCFPVCDYPGGDKRVLNQSQMYLRRSSVNSIGNSIEQKDSWAWFLDKSIEKEVDSSGENKTSEVWESFWSKASSFDFGGYNYGLIVPPLKSDSALLSNIGYVDWFFVIDFDQLTDADGLLSKCIGNLEVRQKVHLTKKDDPTFNKSSRGSTLWYAARGILGVPNTLPLSESYLHWNRMYGNELRNRLNKMAADTTKPTIFIALWDESFPNDFLKNVLESLDSALEERLTVIIVSDSPSEDLKELAVSFECYCYDISVDVFSSTIRHVLSEHQNQLHEDIIALPSNIASMEIPRDKVIWLQEELEIVHLNIGMKPEEIDPGKAFLRGTEISWYALRLHFDVPRMITERLERKIRKDLRSRTAKRIRLYHSPGSGATTVAKRILWNLHKEHPCFLIRKTDPEFTIERLSYIAEQTGKSVLVVADASYISDRESDKLYEKIAAESKPIVLLEVIRSPGNSRIDNLDRFHIESQLTLQEQEDFINHLSRERPDRADLLIQESKRVEGRLLTPFYLALITFERGFTKLSDYVGHRIEKLTPQQKEVILFMALAHYFGQRSIPVQMYAELLSLQANVSVKMEKLLPEVTLEILAQTSQGEWRTAHTLIAEELMQQIMTPLGVDSRNWKRALSEWSIKFANFCRGKSNVPLQIGKDFVYQVFIKRGNSELLGSEQAASRKFSELLEDVPIMESKLAILQRLTELYPEEAHMWAHLGRFFNIVAKDFDRALEAIDRAISLQETDHVLFHMKGMIHRSKIYQMINDKRPFQEALEQSVQASEAFEHARLLEPNDEYGFISEIEMLLRVVDYFKITTQAESHIAAIASASNDYERMREVFQAIEELLEQVRLLRKGDTPSRHEEQCRGKLNLFYGNHSEALQRWDNLLNQKTVYQPPIKRQIIWTYLAKNDHKWSTFKNKEIERCILLLEENMQEEPSSDSNLRLWFRAIRVSKTPSSLDTIIEKLNYWHINSGSLESAYYLFILYTFQSISGSILAREKALDFSDSTKLLARNRRNRKISFEWYGGDEGVQSLVSSTELGQWINTFWSDTSKLKRVEGRVTMIQGPEAGYITLESGLVAFYVPGRAEHHKGESENRRVNFYLGFSYDGLRAWQVEDI